MARHPRRQARGGGSGEVRFSPARWKCPAALASGPAIDAAGSGCSATTRRASHFPRRVSRSAWPHEWREWRSSSRSTRSSASTAARSSGSACPSSATSATALAGIAPSSDTRPSRVSGVARTSRGRTAGRITRPGNRCSARRRPAPAKVTPLDRQSRLSQEPNRHRAETHRALPHRAPSRSLVPAAIPRRAKTPQVRTVLGAVRAKVAPLALRSHPCRERRRHRVGTHRPQAGRSPSWSRPPATVPRLAESPRVQKGMNAGFAIRIT